MLKAVKIVSIGLVVYVGIVGVFESLIGVMQPTDEETLTLTSFDPDGNAHDRVLSRLENDGKLYVAVNHWPRAWFNRIQQQPDVEVTLADGKAKYHAVRVSGPEHDRVASDNGLGVVFRILTGFPPRYFVRLDPSGA